MIFIEEEFGVVDEELADVSFGIAKNSSASLFVADEIEAIVVGAIRRLIEVFDAFFVEAGSGVIVDDVEDHSDAVKVEKIDHRFELVGLAGQLRCGQFRLVLLGEELIDDCDIARQIGALDGVIHFGRENVGAVIAAAGGSLKFGDGQRHDCVHAEVGEIFEPAKDIEIFGNPARPDVLAVGIDGIKDANVELVNEQVVERGRAKTGVVPWIAGWIADDAVVARPAGEAEFAGVRIAFETFRSTDNPETVFVAFLDAWKEPGPMRASNIDEQVRIIFGPVRGRGHVEVAADDVNGFGVAAPDAECGATHDKVRAHGRIG